MSDVVAQRREVVRRVLEGEPVAVVAEAVGRSQRWVRKWVGRYDPADEGWAESQSRAPRRVANRIPAETEQLIVEVRKRLSGHDWSQVGSSQILWELHKLGLGELPSPRTIERVLVRYAVTRRDRRGRYVSKGTRYPAAVATAPNQVQQADLVGPRYLEGGARCYVFNVIDLGRRKAAGEVISNQSADAICEATQRIWGRLGLPDRFHLDNQQALSGAKGRPGKLVRLCLAAGVTPAFIPIAEPWRNGVIEKFNDTFDKKFFRTERFTDPDHLARRYREFQTFHNAHHRYSALGGQTPDGAEAKAAFTPRLPGPDPCIPDTFDGLAGTVEWIRLIRSDHTLRILRRSYDMPQDVVYEYVTATLIVEDHELIVTCHGDEISRHPFPL